MALRGDKLREHILWTAKTVFLEMGYERASMDLIVAHAGTSKRSLYAHFESKENLFLAVIGMVRGLVQKRLKPPCDYSKDPQEALVLFCGRYLETLLYTGAIQLCRITMAESTRFPEVAAQHFDALFTDVHARLSEYLESEYQLSPVDSNEITEQLMGRILYPRFPRALFGVDSLAETIDSDVVSPDFDLEPIRKVVASLIGAIKQASASAPAKRQPT